MPETTGLFAWQHFTLRIAAWHPTPFWGVNEKGRPDGQPLQSLRGKDPCLLCRLLPRRVERAGIVNFRYLVVAEAEHLAQDLIGVFAKQRRAGHLARAVR